MLRYTLRIFREDLASWLPLVTVVLFTAALVGTCVNQLVWTESDPFVAAAVAAGLGVDEFRAVSTTVYIEVAFIAVLALVTVGSATVERCRRTFSQWRLVGATPTQVRNAAFTLVGIAAALGSLAGAIVAVPVSAAAVPLFDDLAAQGFAGGLGAFSPPAFEVSPLAGASSFALAWVTCLLGSFAPARRAARTRPVDALRSPDSASPPRRDGARGRGARHPGASGHPVVGWLLLACAWSMPLVALVARGAADDAPAQMSMAANLMCWAGLLSVLALAAFGGRGVSAALHVVSVVPRASRSVFGAMASRALRANTARDANVVLPLAAALGGGTMLLVMARTLEAAMRRLGFTGTFDYTDISLLFGLAAFFALLTAVAVLVLSRRDENWQQAFLRTLGFSRREVMRLLAWRALLLSLGTGLLAVIPALATAITGSAVTFLLWGTADFQMPIIETGCALTIIGAVVFATQGLQIRRSLMASPAAGLRGGRR